MNSLFSALFAALLILKKLNVIECSNFVVMIPAFTVIINEIFNLFMKITASKHLEKTYDDCLDDIEDLEDIVDEIEKLLYDANEYIEKVDIDKTKSIKEIRKDFVEYREKKYGFDDDEIDDSDIDEDDEDI